MSEIVVLDRMVAAKLIAGHLSEHTSEESDDDVGCCPECCAPCSALRTLRDSGQLDAILCGTYFANGWDYWDDDKDEVSRWALDHLWRMEECHSLIVFDVDETEYVANVKRGDGDDRTFWCEVEGLSGCFATGRTIDELREAATEAVRMVTRV